MMKPNWRSMGLQKLNMPTISNQLQVIATFYKRYDVIVTKFFMRKKISDASYD